MGKHDHAHGHEHNHSSIKNLKIAFILNLSFVVVEIVGGILTNSVAILSDAVHDLGDSISLGLAWYLEKFSTKKSNDKFTYGYKRLSILGALINALVLLVGSGFIIYRAIPRLINPQSVQAEGMIILAVIGIVVNGIAVLRVRKGKKLSEQVVSLHLLEDLFGWVAVLIVSIVLIFVDIPILDPILSLLISIYVLKNVISGLIKIVRLLLQGVPDGFSVEETKKSILQIDPHIVEVHDLRAWTLDGEESILSFHIAIEKNMSVQEVVELKRAIKAHLKQQKIEDVTIEVENIGNCSNIVPQTSPDENYDK